MLTYLSSVSTNKFNFLTLFVGLFLFAQLSAYSQSSDLAFVSNECEWNNPPNKTNQACQDIISKNDKILKKQSSQSKEGDWEKKAKKKKSKLRFTENIGQMDKSVRYHVNDKQADHFFSQ